MGALFMLALFVVALGLVTLGPDLHGGGMEGLPKLMSVSLGQLAACFEGGFLGLDAAFLLIKGGDFIGSELAFFAALVDAFFLAGFAAIDGGFAALAAGVCGRVGQGNGDQRAGQ